MHIEEYITSVGRQHRNEKQNYEFYSISSLRKFIEDWENTKSNPPILKSWECNCCGSKDYTNVISEEEIHSGLLACSNCGGDEFHLTENK